MSKQIENGEIGNVQYQRPGADGIYRMMVDGTFVAEVVRDESVKTNGKAAFVLRYLGSEVAEQFRTMLDVRNYMLAVVMGTVAMPAPESLVASPVSSPASESVEDADSDPVEVRTIVVDAALDDEVDLAAIPASEYVVSLDADDASDIAVALA